MTMAHTLDEGMLSLSFRFGGSPQVEKKKDTVGRVTLINDAISSTLMG
jgi:hypothetical protein